MNPTVIVVEYTQFGEEYTVKYRTVEEYKASLPDLRYLVHRCIARNLRVYECVEMENPLDDDSHDMVRCES